MKDALTKKSKFLSYVLRHRPDSIGITLDREGWTNIKDLLIAANLHGEQMDHSVLDEIVLNNDKKRFAIDPTGTKIRASQGHSIAVKIAYAKKIPPVTLYHGTVAKYIDGIKKKGLLPSGRTHVHLSKDMATAITVAERKGKPIILEIKAENMNSSNFDFYLSENGVWLIDHVPVKYIVFPKTK